MANKKNIVQMVRGGQRVQVGAFTLFQCDQGSAVTKGKVWLENEIGEGCTVDEAKVERALKRIFAKEF